MSVSYFVKNTMVEINQRPFKLLRKFDQYTWQVEDQRTGNQIQIKTEELLQHFAKGELIFINDLTNITYKEQAFEENKREQVAMLKLNSKQIQRMKEIRAYVKATENLPISQKIIQPVIHDVWVKLGGHDKPPNWTTVSRWRKKYIHHGGNAYALLPQHFKKGNRVKRICSELITILENSIQNVYLTRERKTVEDTLSNAIVHAERENKLRPSSMQINLPTRRMLQSRINEIDHFDRYAARHGQMAATRKFRAVLHMNVTDSPLECAEIDHTKLDLIVVDGKSGMILGRPWVTVCIDRHTRCILGLYVGFEPPSYLTVARCLKHAFTPKVNLKEMYPEIHHDWCAYGVMQKLIVDNGLEFHGDGLEKVCLFFGIDLQFTPRKTPWWKGVVERYIGTMNRGIAHGNPGTTFANIFEKEDYDSLKNAVISFDKLKLIMNKWVADVYHQKPHTSLDGYSPEYQWNANVSEEDVRLPSSLKNLDAIMGKPDVRVLTHKGIEYEKLLFNSIGLVNLRRRFGDKLKVNIRVDEGNLEKIYVIAPDNSEIIEAPCLDQEYAKDLSMWQHKVCIRYAALEMKKNLGNNVNAWRHAKEEMSEIVMNEMLSGKKRTHSKSKRFQGNKQLTEIKVEPVKPNIEPIKPTKTVESNLPITNSDLSEMLPLIENRPLVKKFNAIIQDR